VSLVETFSRYLVCPKRVEQLQSHGFAGLSLHRPTKDWFAGFWDAEGYSYSGGSSWHIGLAQKDKSVLEAIKKFWDFGRVGKLSWIVSKEVDRLEVLDSLLAKSRNRKKKIKLVADAGLDLSEV